MKFIYALAAAVSGAALASAGNVPYPNTETVSFPASDEGRIETALESYASSLQTVDGFAAYTSAIASAAGGLDGLQEALTASGTPTWWTELPSSVQAFATSVLAAEVSIVKANAAPTAAPVLNAAQLAAAGVAAGAMMLL